MNGFVPRGYLTLRQALDRVAQSLFGDEWRGTIPSEDEKAALARQARATEQLRAYSRTGRAARGGAVPSRRPDRQELQEGAADTPETRAAQAKLKRRLQLRNRAIEPLQQALFAGDVLASILSEGGTLYDVPTRVWGSADAAGVFVTGNAEFSTRRAPYDGPSTIGGRVLLDEASVDAWLTAAKSPPAPAKAPTAAQAAPKTESPDPYKSGLPGRPSVSHLVEQEFERRIERDVVCSTLADEVRELRAWASKEHPTAPRLAQTSVENQLRERYLRHKAESVKATFSASCYPWASRRRRSIQLG